MPMRIGQEFKRSMHSLIFIMLIFSSGTGLASSLNCDSILHGENLAPTVNIELRHENAIYVNGIPVTGEFVYPLDFVLKNLNLESPNTKQDLAEKKIVSLGEGASGLLPYLIQQGAQAKGVDLWYHSDDIPQNFSGKKMRSYVKSYGDELIRADARRTPLESGGTDLVLSHMLFNNLSVAKQRSTMREVIRLLKPGGEARISGFGEPETQLMQKFIDTNFASEVSYKFEAVPYELEFGDTTHAGTMNLLILIKDN